jgi:hypothetical protein
MEKSIEEQIYDPQAKNVITIAKARKLLGAKWSHLSDEQLEVILKELSLLANAYIGNYLNCNDNENE